MLIFNITGDVAHPAVRVLPRWHAGASGIYTSTGIRASVTGKDAHRHQLGAV